MRSPPKIWPRSTARMGMWHLRHEPLSTPHVNLRARRATCWSADRSTSLERSYPSRTSAQVAHAEVNAARDHGQQKGQAKRGPQEPPADGKPDHEHDG